jgi:hypothetical protein
MASPDRGRALDWINATLAGLADALPEQYRAARKAIAVVLQPLEHSAWPEVAWSFSPLAPGGMPFEFSWRPGAKVLGWTSEVAGPETPEHRRLRLAVRQVRALNAPAPPEDMVRAIGGAQHGRALAWGAWIGVKHRKSASSYKIYAELQGDAAGQLLPVLGDAAGACLGRDLRGLGIDGAGSIEIYGKLGNDDAGWLAAFAAEVGLAEAYRALIKRAAGMLQRPSLATDLEDINTGWSIAWSPDRRPMAISLFFQPGAFAVNEDRIEHLMTEISTGTATDLAWSELVREGICTPGPLGLVATGGGLTTQLAIVPGRARPSPSPIARSGKPSPAARFMT